MDSHFLKLMLKNKEIVGLNLGLVYFLKKNCKVILYFALGRMLLIHSEIIQFHYK